MLFILRKITAISLGLFLLFSCKESKKTLSKDSKTIENHSLKIEKKEDFIIFESLLVKENIQIAKYNNIVFSDNGAKFKRDEESYIHIPKIDIDLNKEFNISFWFKFNDEFGPKPPALFVYKNKYSSPSNSPFYVFLPAKRVSGVIGDQMLFAENYNSRQGYSRKYYDSFQLSPGTFYFLSINKKDSILQIYVNSELYSEYDNLIYSKQKGEEIYLGAFPHDSEFKNPFEGSIKGLKIYSRALMENEIVNLYNSEPNLE